MHFETSIGFQLVDSCEFLFAPRNIGYINICKFVRLNVSKTSHNKVF